MSTIFRYDGRDIPIPGHLVGQGDYEKAYLSEHHKLHVENLKNTVLAFAIPLLTFTVTVAGVTCMGKYDLGLEATLTSGLHPL